MLKKRIRLYDAMGSNVNYWFPMWQTPGLPIIIKDPVVDFGHQIPRFTYVRKLSCDQYELGVCIDYSLVVIEKFSGLENLIAKYPKLFKEEGTLYYFDNSF